MMDSAFQQEGDLGEIILKIITEYQPIATKDIWYELGEDYGFIGSTTLDEVNEALSQLEKQKMIIKGENDKWKMKTVIAKNRRRLLLI